MRYKIFLCDFDGTLARSDGTVSRKCAEAIARYRAAGGIFAICTGRMLPSILPRLAECGIDGGLVVAYQGAVVADVKTGKLLKNDCFSAEKALKVVGLLEAEGVHFHVYTEEGMFSNRDDAWLEAYERVCGVKGLFKDEPLSAWIAREKPSVIKILAMLPSEEKYALQERLEGALGKDYYVTCSAEFLVEVLPAGQNKSAAVGFLSDYYAVPVGEIAAIGDQCNDLPMIGAAGGKFTVANGVEELKRTARVMPSNDDDGVAYALEYAMGDET